MMRQTAACKHLAGVLILCFGLLGGFVSKWDREWCWDVSTPLVFGMVVKNLVQLWKWRWKLQEEQHINEYLIRGYKLQYPCVLD